MYRLTLRRSPIKLPSKKLLNVKALGLRKTTGSVSFMPVTPSVAGKILEVKELLKVELVDAGAQERETQWKKLAKEVNKGWSKVAEAAKPSSS